MRIYETQNYEEMSQKAAAVIAAQIIAEPKSVLGLATGSTPIGIYQQLIKWYQAGILDFSEIAAVNLDEYKGLAKENEQSYAYFMKQNLFSHVNISDTATHIPDGTTTDSKAECQRYEQQIESIGGVHLQLLGLGHNGHIGFNEPNDAFALTTHCVDLQESTIEANKRFFASVDEVPRQAYTMGCGTIMKARKIVMVVCGADKAEAVAQSFFGPVTPQVPASILQMHSDVTLIGDTAALSKLPR